MIALSCSSCGQRLSIKEEMAGRKGKCPKCGKPVQVPSLDRSAGADWPPAPGALAVPPPPAILVTERLKGTHAAAAIEHDHIITIHQVGEDRGVLFLALPFLKGESLDARLNRDSSLPVPEVLRIGREIAEGLDAAHQHGLIHRDIKPGNIWLESRGQQSEATGQKSEVRGQKSEVGGRVKILDFGMVRTADSKTHLTQTGAILGTPAYIAPEQARGLPVDARCDLFSLGGMLSRMSTGTLPFKGTDPMSILLAVTSDQPEPPRKLNPAVPAALSDLIMRLLAKDPKDRPASARAVVEAIEVIGAGARNLCETCRVSQRFLAPAASG